MSHENLDPTIIWKPPTFWIRRPEFEDEPSTRSQIRTRVATGTLDTSGALILNDRGESASVAEFVSDQYPALVEPFEVAHSLAYHRQYKETWDEDTRLSHLARLTGLLRFEFGRLRSVLTSKTVDQLLEDDVWKQLSSEALGRFACRYYKAIGYQVWVIPIERCMGADLIVFTAFGLKAVKIVGGNTPVEIDHIQQL